MRRRNTTACALLALLLSACQVNVVTRLETSGAGTLTVEIGLTPDEETELRALAGDPEASPCAGLARQAADDEGIPSLEEERRGQGTWCVAAQAFDNGSQLVSLYRRLDGISIRELVEREGILVYDIDVHLQAPQQAPAGPPITWALELPGTIGHHNADRFDGQRLEWILRPGESRRLTASSDLYAPTLPGRLGAVPQWLLIGGGALLCLGLAVVTLVIGLGALAGRGRRKSPGMM